MGNVSSLPEQATVPARYVKKWFSYQGREKLSRRMVHIQVSIRMFKPGQYWLFSLLTDFSEFDFKLCDTQWKAWHAWYFTSSQATKWHKGCRYNLMNRLKLFTLKGKLKYITYKMQCILNKYNNLNYLIPDTMWYLLVYLSFAANWDSV